MNSLITIRKEEAPTRPAEQDFIDSCVANGLSPIYTTSPLGGAIMVEFTVADKTKVSPYPMLIGAAWPFETRPQSLNFNADATKAIVIFGLTAAIRAELIDMGLMNSVELTVVTILAPQPCI